MTLQTGTLVNFDILADDIDPLDFTQAVVPGGAQPGVGPVLMRNVSIVAPSQSTGQDTTYTVAAASPIGTISFQMPSGIFQPGPANVHISVCDYRPGDAALGFTGRCSPETIVPITITGTVPADATTGASQPTDRPGSPSADGRRQQ